MVVYLLLALLAVSLPDRAAITESDAPMSEIFEMVSGFDGAPIATIASFAMLNGILVQMVMASRVLYGMASDGQIHKSFAAVHPKYHTPAFATAVVASVVIVLALLFPLVRLARVTSIVTLTVFTLVNLALYRIGASRPGTSMHRWRWNGLIGATVAAGLAIYDILPFDVA